MPRIEIRGDHIKLAQLLKLAGFLGTGGEAREFLSAAQITVNGEPEDRRGRKIRPGDVVMVDNDKIEVVAEQS